MKRFAITLVALFALAGTSMPVEAANNNWDLAKSPSRPSVSSYRVDVGNGNGNVDNGNAPNVSRHRHHHHHHHHGDNYGRSSYPYGYGYYPVIAYPSYGYGGYGYYNSGIPAASFANPAAYGFGPGALFGW